MLSKVLAPIVQKGGTGKSFVGTQFAMFAKRRGCSVAFVDFDHQQNASNTLRAWGELTVSDMPAVETMTKIVTEHPDFSVNDNPAAGDGSLVLFAADDDALLGLERQGDKQHNVFASNLRVWLRSAPYDLVVIDTNPSADIRQVAALASATHVVAPITLSQESVDGVAAFLRNPRIGVLRIRETINPDLKLLGLLLNQVRRTNFQSANLAALAKHYAKLLMTLESGQPAAIPLSTSIPEAQANGTALEDAAKKSSTARDTWTAIRPIWEHMAKAMELPVQERHS